MTGTIIGPRRTCQRLSTETRTPGRTLEDYTARQVNTGIVTDYRRHPQVRRGASKPLALLESPVMPGPQCGPRKGVPRNHRRFCRARADAKKTPGLLPQCPLGTGILCDGNASSLRKGVRATHLLTTDALFACDIPPDSPDLTAVRFLLDLLPDERLLTTLRAYCDRGRNDYPMPILWRVHVTRHLLRRGSMEACGAELGHKPALRGVVGSEDSQGVPDARTISRSLQAPSPPSTRISPRRRPATTAATMTT